MELNEIRAGLVLAYQGNDEPKIKELEGMLNEAKATAKASELAKAKVEFDAMATIRTEVATAIYKGIAGLAIGDKKLKPLLESVKASGFTFKLDVPAGEGVEAIQFKSVALTVAGMAKAKGAKTGNGGSGKTKEQYGMSLDDAYTAFATDADKLEFANAEATLEGHSKNSKQWQIKTKVKNKAIADGMLKPVA